MSLLLIRIYSSLSVSRGLLAGLCELPPLEWALHPGHCGVASCPANVLLPVLLLLVGGPGEVAAWTESACWSGWSWSLLPFWRFLCTVLNSRTSYVRSVHSSKSSLQMICPCNEHPEWETQPWKPLMYPEAFSHSQPPPIWLVLSAFFWMYANRTVIVFLAVASLRKSIFERVICGVCKSNHVKLSAISCVFTPKR